MAVSEERILEGGGDFPAAIFLAGKCPNLGRDLGVGVIIGPSEKKGNSVLNFGSLKNLEIATAQAPSFVI